MKNGLWLGTLLSTVWGAALAADLNTPTNATPTVETEIRRGMDAETACNATVVAAEYAHCVFAIEDRNRQRLLDYNPFDIGLFFKAWSTMDARANAGSAADHDEAAQHQAASLYTVYRAYQRKVGVTDDFVITISGLSASLVESRIAFWDSQPP